MRSSSWCRPPRSPGRLPAVGKRATRTPAASAGVMAVARVEQGDGRNTGSLAGGVARANRQPARARWLGRTRAGWRRGPQYRGSRVTPVEEGASVREQRMTRATAALPGWTARRVADIELQGVDRRLGWGTGAGPEGGDLPAANGTTGPHPEETAQQVPAVRYFLPPRPGSADGDDAGVVADLRSRTATGAARGFGK